MAIQDKNQIAAIPAAQLKAVSDMVTMFKAAGEGSAHSAAALKGMLAQLDKFNSSAKQTPAATKKVNEAMKLMADQYAASTNIMTKETKERFEAEIEYAKKSNAAMKKAGSSDRASILINEQKIRDRQSALRQNDREMAIAQAKANSSTFSSMWGGITNSSRKHGAEAAGAIGEFFGMTEERTAALAESATLPLAILTALSMVISGTSKSAIDAAQAGNTLGSTMEAGARSGVVYTGEILAASIATGQHSEELKEYTQILYQTLGRASGYTAEFAGDIADVGQRFGIAGKDSVEFAARLAASSRDQANKALGTERLFTATGMVANRLGVSIKSMMDPMAELAELAGSVGDNSSKAGNELGYIAQTVQDLGKNGMAMFKNLSPAATAKMVKNFTDVIAKMDDLSLAAYTYGNYKSAGGMVNGVIHMDAGGKLDAMKQMMNDFHLSGKGLKGNDLTMSQWALGSILNPGGDMKSQVALAAFVQQGGKGGMNAFNANSARDIDKELQDRKTAGAVFAAGEDPLKKILDLMFQVVRYLEAMTGSWILSAGAGKALSLVKSSVSDNGLARNPSNANYGANSVNRVGLQARP